MKLLKSKITKNDLEFLQSAAVQNQNAEQQLAAIKEKIAQAESIFLQASGAFNFIKQSITSKYKLQLGDSINFDDGSILRAAQEINKMIEGDSG